MNIRELRPDRIRHLIPAVGKGEAARAVGERRRKVAAAPSPALARPAAKTPKAARRGAAPPQVAFARAQRKAGAAATGASQSIT
ncbi:hypothetical protein FHX40_1947 [Thermopolyspora flexuosa]|uniref:Uncharacterized protein n=1 Tax=Thermopolyspora flexuosa TaxID=103836 RepID=A0A543IXE4_9ACTN|nr:hypothetical protein FHX40_1947 [Thermopolyspora flexuosa]